MKAHVMQMVTIDAMHKALEQYDQEPNSKDPRKLYNNIPVDLVAMDPSSLPKQFADARLVDITLGELLGLSVMGAFYQHSENKGYHIVFGLDTSSKHHVETILSDGAIRAFDSKSRMIFQQVSVQGYRLPRGSTIEDEIVRQIQYKEAKRRDYPKKCALLINVYAERGGFFVKRIMDECSMEAFDIYFCVLYHNLPELDTCTVLYLRKGVNPDLIVQQGFYLALDRHGH